MFHITFKRELDGGYRVKAQYNFEQVSGLKELNCYNNKTNEKKFLLIMIFYYLS